MHKTLPNQEQTFIFMWLKFCNSTYWEKYGTRRKPLWVKCITKNTTVVNDLVLQTTYVNSIGMIYNLMKGTPRYTNRVDMISKTK